MYSRHGNAVICALVQSLAESNSLLPVPLLIPLSAAHVTAFAQ